MGALAWAVALAGCSASQGPVERALEGHEQELQVRPVKPHLQLSCAPADAEVLLDGVLQGSCSELQDLRVVLGGGAHALEVRRSGFSTYRAQVEAGQARTKLRVELVPLN